MPTLIAQTLSDERVSISYDAQTPVKKVRGMAKVRQRRARNHRLQIVRNTVSKAGVAISAEHKVRREDGRYVLTILGSGESFPLPRLDYARKNWWKELRLIWAKVLEDIMIRNDLQEIKSSLAALHEKVSTLATKDDLKALPTKEDLNLLATKEDFGALSAKFDTFSAATTGALYEINQATSKILEIVAQP